VTVRYSLDWHVENQEALVRVNEVTHGVVNDRSTGGVHECHDATYFLRGYWEITCALDIDSHEKIHVMSEWRRGCCVDDRFG